jgi:hypothetical protein
MLPQHSVPLHVNRAAIPTLPIRSPGPDHGSDNIIPRTAMRAGQKFRASTANFFFCFSSGCVSRIKLQRLCKTRPHRPATGKAYVKSGVPPLAIIYGSAPCTLEYEWGFRRAAGDLGRASRWNNRSFDCSRRVEVAFDFLASNYFNKFCLFAHLFGTRMIASLR